MQTILFYNGERTWFEHVEKLYQLSTTISIPSNLEKNVWLRFNSNLPFFRD